jgi:hypothetical protein
MDEALSKEDLAEDLCNYCELTDYGLTEINNAPWNMCEGICCDKAYENYLEDFEEENE